MVDDLSLYKYAYVFKNFVAKTFSMMQCVNLIYKRIIPIKEAELLIRKKYNIVNNSDLQFVGIIPMKVLDTGFSEEAIVPYDINRA